MASHVSQCMAKACMCDTWQAMCVTHGMLSVNMHGNLRAINRRAQIQFGGGGGGGGGGAARRRRRKGKEKERKGEEKGRKGNEKGKKRKEKERRKEKKKGEEERKKKEEKEGVLCSEQTRTAKNPKLHYKR